MNVTDQANLASSMKLMKELEEIIISKARPIFGPKTPNGHTYEVIVSKYRKETSYEYEARLIVYTGDSAASFGGWKVLLTNPSLCESPVDAMADLLEGLYEQTGHVLIGATVGETYNRGWRKA